MTNSHFLNLPFIMPAQAQKHVTHNEAVKSLDSVTHLAVTGLNVSNPPVAPVEGDRFGISSNPTGVWDGHAGQITVWLDNAWVYFTPHTGWTAWAEDLQVFRVFDGTDWIEIPQNPATEFQNLNRLGINASADSQNRLSVSSSATLLSHEGSGHQVKINKNSAADTASILYQSGFSSRAEIGLVGDDRFSFKSSIDGSSWQEHIGLDPSYPGLTTQSARSGKITLDFETATHITTPAPGGIFIVSLTNSAGFPKPDHSGIFAYDCGASRELVTLVALSGLNNEGSTTLTGTTGPSNKTSISAQEGSIQIENRFQIAREYTYLFLC